MTPICRVIYLNNYVQVQKLIKLGLDITSPVERKAPGGSHSEGLSILSQLSAHSVSIHLPQGLRSAKHSRKSMDDGCGMSCSFCW